MHITRYLIEMAEGQWIARLVHTNTSDKCPVCVWAVNASGAHWFTEQEIDAFKYNNNVTDWLKWFPDMKIRKITFEVQSELEPLTR